MSKRLKDLQTGDALGVSPWIEVSQDKIDAFAKATGDHQWIHVDAERCQKESPFKTTIAHGLLSTALMPAVFYDMVGIDDATDTVLNYGMDTLRFLEPVRVDDKIRYNVSLESIQEKATGKLYRFDCTVEIENRDKPAMVGRFLMLLVG